VRRLAFAILLLAATMPALAHEQLVAGKFALTVGWAEEPVYSGLKNAVEIHVTDRAGGAVRDLKASLSVEVSFGDQRMTLPLLPMRERPNTWYASLMPTRAGTYAFRFTGTLNEQPVDVTSVCSEKTFDCVVDVAAVQFPAKDPPTGQLVEGLSRALPRTDQALASSTRALTLGLASIALAVLALAIAVVLGVRKGRTGH
jgi:hypothetical protein